MYNINLPQFEGPFDLLLFFIERDELDIYDIPIAKVTNDFLEYIRVMESMNIDLASEFILVASTLMRIKSKMLLPRKELDEAGNEIDPREMLVERLLEYKRYKAVLEDFRVLEQERSMKELRGNTTKEIKKIAEKALVDSELESLSLYKLLTTFQQILERFEDANKEVKHKVIRYEYTIKGQKRYLVDLVSSNEKIDFKKAFELCENKIHAIFTFLAILDLLQLQALDIVIGEGINNFWLTKREITDEIMESLIEADYDDKIPETTT
ncbi:MAG: segregation/condensation protein A [Saprospiraceae bacterium]|nr:segregation/condensation protein A [Saprospiraceae bacterium]